MPLVALPQVQSSPAPLPPPPPQAISIPFEMLFFGGVALLIAGVKWLVGREVDRLDKSLVNFDKRLSDLERAEAGRQSTQVAVSRLEGEVAQLDTDVQAVKQVLAALPRIERKVERLDDLSASVTTLSQRFENLGFALNQTQELFHGHQKELSNLQSQIARDYVLKEDDTRHKAILDKKVDALWAQMDRVRGRNRAEEDDDRD